MSNIFIMGNIYDDPNDICFKSLDSELTTEQGDVVHGTTSRQKLASKFAAARGLKYKRHYPDKTIDKTEARINRLNADCIDEADTVVIFWNKHDKRVEYAIDYATKQNPKYVLIFHTEDLWKAHRKKT